MFFEADAKETWRYEQRHMGLIMILGTLLVPVSDGECMDRLANGCAPLTNA